LSLNLDAVNGYMARIGGGSERRIFPSLGGLRAHLKVIESRQHDAGHSNAPEYQGLDLT